MFLVRCVGRLRNAYPEPQNASCPGKWFSGIPDDFFDLRAGSRFPRPTRKLAHWYNECTGKPCAWLSCSFRRPFDRFQDSRLANHQTQQGTDHVPTCNKQPVGRISPVDSLSVFQNSLETQCEVQFPERALDILGNRNHSNSVSLVAGTQNCWYGTNIRIRFTSGKG